MKHLYFALSSIMLFIAAAGAAPAEESTGNKVPRHVPRIEAKISVDGSLDEAAWAEALALELAYETQPGENVPASVKTEVLVFYDAGNVYFGVRCYDPEPSSIRARYADRDSHTNDDTVIINIDTFNDERRNYYFSSNALGIQSDGIESTSGSDNNWDAIWDCAGQITDYGYCVEYKLPFACMQFQRTAGPQIWGLDISRHRPRALRRRFGLVPIDRSNNSYQSQFMKIQGFEGITPGKNFELTPTLTAISTDMKKEPADSDFSLSDDKTDVGLTARWGMTSNINVVATVNPDFSQVEADARQLDINQPFALYFDEKRPFFVEGADFFKTQLEVLHTRTLRDPSWGVKLTGKEDANTLGAYIVQDDLTNLIFPGTQHSRSTSIAKDSTAAVFRYKRDFGTRYTVGAMVTDREGTDYFNRIVGVDGALRFSDVDKITFQALGSSTRYPAEVAKEFGQPVDTFDDSAISLDYAHETRSLDWSLDYEEIGPGFRADLGYIPQVGYRRGQGAIGYTWISENPSWWSDYSAGSELNYTEDSDGNLLLSEARMNFQFNGTLQTYLYLDGFRSREVFNGEQFDLSGFDLMVRTFPTAIFSSTLTMTLGDSVDYSNTRLGGIVYVEPSVTLNLGRRLKMSLSHMFERMESNEQHLYTANISQFTGIYHLGSRMFFRAIFQYVDYGYNVENYTYQLDPEFRQLFTQLLFSYKLNPRTVLFLGYSDNYYGNQDFSLSQNDRTLFLKIGYAGVL